MKYYFLLIQELRAYAPPPKILIKLKLTVILMLCAFLQVSAISKAQNITLSEKNAPMEKVLKAISDQSGFNFIYSMPLIRSAKPVSMKVNNLQLLKVLDICFENQPFSYTIENKTIILKPRPVHQLVGILQGVISGTVKNEEGFGIENVSITVKGTSFQQKTDKNGKFQITADEGDILVFTSVGYTTREFKVGSNKIVNITMLQSEGDLNEVVVVAYGKQTKASITGAISTVTAEDLRTSTVASFGNALAGRLSGLSSTQMGGGMPGDDDATLYLRGAATLNGNTPLIIIDGVARDNIRTIDVNEVESVSVLKDASATAVYGVRGANGVIIITTKRGKPGAAELSFTGTQTFTSFTRQPERLSALEYIDMRNQAFVNDGYEVKFSPEVRAKYENPLLGLDPAAADYEQQAAKRRYLYADHYYYGEMFKKYAPESRFNANVRGGTDKVSYFVNVGYLNQGGHLNLEPDFKLNYDPELRLDRWSFRANLDYKMSDVITARLNIASYIEKQNTPNPSNFASTEEMMRGLIQTTMQLTPITIGPLTMEGFNDGVAGNQVVFPSYVDTAPFVIINRNGYRVFTRTNLNSSFELNFNMGKLTPGLSARTMIAYDAYPTTTLIGKRDEVSYIATPDYVNDGVSYAEKSSYERTMELSRTTSTRYSINAQAAINYDRKFGKHQVTGLVLGQRDYWESDGADIPFNLLGVAARATYNYDQRYFAEANMGYNGSEQFAPKKRFGFFPAGSAAWIASNESFFPKNDVLTFLKFRGSYGKVGNDKMGDRRFLYMDDVVLTGGAGMVGGLGGQVINFGLLGNYNMTWEIANKVNLGVEFQFFKDLNLSVDLFKEHREQILITRRSVPVYQGVPGGNIPKANLGVVDNKGFEVELGYSKVIKRDLHIRVKGNFGFNKNILIDNDEPRRDPSYAAPYDSRYLPMSQPSGYKVDWGSPGKGYWTSTEEIANSGLKYGSGKPRPGDLKFLDMNGDNVLDSKDMVPIGSSSIPGITYGFDAGITYKNFDVMALFAGVGRLSSVWIGEGVYESIREGTYYGFHKNAWTQERFDKGEKITYPALSTGTSVNHNSNEFFLQDRSFIRLKNVEIGYTLPKKALQALGVKTLRVFATGQNLFLWDNLTIEHQDPEKTNPVRYPITKTVGFGLNVTF